jgi:hypothetical protein
VLIFGFYSAPSRHVSNVGLLSVHLDTVLLKQIGLRASKIEIWSTRPVLYYKNCINNAWTYGCQIIDSKYETFFWVGNSLTAEPQHPESLIVWPWATSNPTTHLIKIWFNIIHPSNGSITNQASSFEVS